MRKHFIAALLSVAVASPSFVSIEAVAQRHSDRDGRYRDRDERFSESSDRRWQGDQDNRDWDPSTSYQSGSYRERRLGRNDRIYRGRDGRAYCRRSDGTTGLVVGGVAGGLLGNLVGGGTLGTLAGAGGGALLGRSVDRGNIKCR